MPPAALGPDEAHVWCVGPAAAARRPALRALGRRLLDPEEEARLERIALVGARHEFLLTRALCRTVLSRYADVRPEEWRFRKNAYGRPEVAGPRGCPRLRFSLSGARGLVACAVTSGADAGLDVEHRAAARGSMALAGRFFSALEAGVLQAAKPAARRERFLEYWTLKEAFLKAIGRGLSLPLDRLTFHLDEGPRIRVSLAPGLEEEPGRWQFALFRPTARHVMALGIRRPGGTDLRISVREAFPPR
ncbi:MAG: 4'-phosphopantetheinyl transferase superfamily protein [Elusimicrobia bacterium]|nr:4'-phosphopantetheinyl transferase superfamily protein [Elusimicrobiota bacterium]